MTLYALLKYAAATHLNGGPDEALALLRNVRVLFDTTKQMLVPQNSAEAIAVAELSEAVAKIHHSDEAVLLLEDWCSRVKEEVDLALLYFRLGVILLFDVWKLLPSTVRLSSLLQ